MIVHRTNPRGEHLLVTAGTVYVVRDGVKHVIHKWGLVPGAYIPR